MNQSQIWNELHGLFDTDDGSLPEINISNLSSSQVEDIYLFFISSGKAVTKGGAYFWDKELKQEQAVHNVANAATLVVQYKAEPFHMIIGELTLNNITIPDLGLFVFQDSVSLDYRMGSAWGPENLAALFEYLYQIKKLAPDMQLTLQEGEISEVQKKFQRIWKQYQQERESPQD